MRRGRVDAAECPPPRVVMITPRYLPIFGGAEIQCRALVRRLHADRLARVPFIVTTRSRADLPRREVIDAVPVLRLGHPDIGARAELRFAIGAALILSTRRRRFDLIHCHSTSVVLMACLAAVARGVRRPLVVKLSGHGLLGSGPATDWKLRLKRRLAASCSTRTTMIALNREGLDECRVCYPRARSVLIPNGVDRAVFHPPDDAARAAARAALGLRRDQVMVLYVGRFVRGKGLQDLLDAWSLIAADPRLPRDAILAVAGSGDLQIDAIDVDAAARAMGGDRVRVLPPQVPPVPYYHAADVFVSPSHREGMPNSVIEALACGLPCVLSAIGPHREIAQGAPDGEVMLTVTGDARALAEGIVASVERRGRVAVNAALNDLRCVAQRYGRLYRQLSQK